MKPFSLKNIFQGLILLHSSMLLIGQENILSHYFSASSFYNPAMAGDTRFTQIQLNERIQSTISNFLVSNTLFSFDYKLLNHRSGIGVYINRRSSVFSETQIKSNYSHTLLLFKKLWIKGGLGISLNIINSHVNSYKFPDQYDRYGYTGNPTSEPSLNEKAFYFGFSSGFAVDYRQGWLSMAVNNINRPVIDFAGSEERAPLFIAGNAGYLFPLDKGKKAKRIFSRDGGIEPYSSIGPVVSFFKEGAFQVIGMGVNAFTKPVFWGVSWRYNAINSSFFSDGIASINFLAGFRNEILSLAYSYDFMLNRTPTNYKGVHEISLVYYFYTIREDYKTYELFPYPNQLMY